MTVWTTLNLTQLSSHRFILLVSALQETGNALLKLRISDEPVHPKRDHSWAFIGRTDAEAETPMLWLSDAKSWLIWKCPHAGKDWGQEENGMTEDEMSGWHHQLNGCGFGSTLGVGDGQGGLGVLRFMGLPRVRHDSDWTELNWNDLFLTITSGRYITNLILYNSVLVL